MDLYTYLKALKMGRSGSLFEDLVAIKRKTGSVIKTEFAAIASFITKRAQTAIAVEVQLDPIQDLNGYDKPWVGGAGKNKLSLDTNVTVLSGSVPSAVTITSGDGSATITENYYNRDANKFGWAFNVESNQTYAVSGNITSSYNTTIKIYATDGSVVYTYTLSSSQTTFSLSFDSGTNTTLYFYASITSWGQTITLNNVQIEKGTATSYEPYSNICPISGRTECVTEVRGKNFATDAVFGYSGVSRKTYGTGMADLIAFLNALPYGTYTISADMRVDAVGSTSKAMEFGFYGSTTAGTINKIITRTNPPIGTVIRPSFTVTISESNKVNSMYIYASSNTDGDLATISNWQIELGTTATDYEPYESDTYTTDLGRTVYGGTLDVVSGELVVDRAKVDLGTLNWRYDSGGYFQAVFSDDAKHYTSSETANAICSSYAVTSVLEATSRNGYFGIYYYASGAKNYIRVHDEAYTDATAFKTAVTGQTICYELSEPQTYQLTPTEVSLLLGQNNVWSDGDVSVTYVG